MLIVIFRLVPNRGTSSYDVILIITSRISKKNHLHIIFPSQAVGVRVRVRGAKG